MWVHGLDDSDAASGGKAVGLAKLRAAGLHVPAGFVLDHRAFDYARGELAPERDAIGHALDAAARRVETVELPAALVAAVDTHADALAASLAGSSAAPAAGSTIGSFAVRSSATIEDGDAGAAAGVFSSRTAVPRDQLWPAIRAVWASALTPLAASYARHRGDGAIAIGVIVQPFIAGDRATIYTRPPGAPDDPTIWLQIGERLVKLARDHHSPIAALADAVEAAIAAPRGADIELILPPPRDVPSDPDEDADPSDEIVASIVAMAIAAKRAWIVQARPIAHPSPQPKRLPPPPALLAPLEDGRTWTWDVAHNPDPLSPAQAGLVERVEAAGIAPWSMRVVAGYLYTSPLVPPASELPTLADLQSHVDALEAIISTRLDRLEPVAKAIDDYLVFYRAWAELSPIAARARAAYTPKLTAAQLRELGFKNVTDRQAHIIRLALDPSVERRSAIDVLLGSRMRGEITEEELFACIGVVAPAWDVAVPTFAERFVLVRDAVARIAKAESVERLTDAEAQVIEDLREYHRGFAAKLPDNPGLRAALEINKLGRLVADLAERDDLWFAKAQWHVRRALLHRATELTIDPDDVCWLPLDEIATTSAIDPDDARRRASAARAANQRSTSWAMPIVVGGPTVEAGPQLRGIGSGGVATGRVVKFSSLASAIVVGTGDVVVTRAVTPALAVFVVGCAALVSETGQPLDHGASLARELGIPCIVGCRDAWLLLADGMIVTVDANTGVVTIR